MHSIRDILKQDQTGFMSLQNSPSCTDMALLLAFGPKLDPVALELWLHLERSKPWTKQAFKLARHLRWRHLNGDYDDENYEQYSVKQEKFMVPDQARLDVRAMYAQLAAGKKITTNNGEYEWLNGG